MGGDGSFGFWSKCCGYNISDDVATGCSGDRFNLLSGTLIMACEEGQGSQRASGATIQCAASSQVISEHFQAAPGKPHYGFLVAFANDDRLTFIPIYITAP